jgi:hypothetical protein
VIVIEEEVGIRKNTSSNIQNWYIELFQMHLDRAHWRVQGFG